MDNNQRQALWDGGIVSSSPLDQVIDRCGATGKRISLLIFFRVRKRYRLI